MLVLAAFSLLGVFRLAERVANTNVAIASTLCTALYPVFFAQSSLAHLDLAAAGLTFWALSAYVEGEVIATVFWFALAALAKETAILAPIALAGWEIIGLLARNSALRTLWLDGENIPQGLKPAHFLDAIGTLRRASLAQGRLSTGSRFLSKQRRIASLLIPVLPLGLWYAYHYAHTGYVFGNPGILSLQRGGDSESRAISFGADHAAVASRRLSPFVGSDFADAAGDVSAGTAA